MKIRSIIFYLSGTGFGQNMNVRSRLMKNWKGKWIHWLPGLVFLSAQFFNTLFEMAEDTQNLAWAPHTVHIQYQIKSYKSGKLVSPEIYPERYGVEAAGWEHHKIGNLIRVIENSEQGKITHPDSILLIYTINSHHDQIRRWTFSK